MVKEINSPGREIPSYVTNAERNSDDISYEEEKDDKDMEMQSSKEDMNLYTDQEITSGRNNLSAYKKNTSSKIKKTSDRRSKRGK